MSRHLAAIMEQHNRVANLQVVFVDVEKYSQRRTLTQIQVVDRLTDALQHALTSVSKQFVEYSQANSVNFQEDVIRLPTGDGGAVVFTFDGLHDIHLHFAVELLKYVHALNARQRCEKFDADGWCNCHANFNLTIGIAEGRGIVYRDLNGAFNVAGGVVNMAARVMGLADRNQILFTEEAYRQIVDMVDNPHLVDHFAEFSGLRIKHGHALTIYQYIDSDADYLNSKPPERAAISQAMETVKEKMSSLGMGPSLDFDTVAKLDPQKVLSKFEKMADLCSQLRQLRFEPDDQGEKGITTE